MAHYPQDYQIRPELYQFCKYNLDQKLITVGCYALVLSGATARYPVCVQVRLGIGQLSSWSLNEGKIEILIGEQYQLAMHILGSFTTFSVFSNL